MVKDISSRCVICSSSDFNIHRKISSRLNEIPDGLVRGKFVEVSILKCAKCGLLYQGGESNVTQIYEESINLAQTISKFNDSYSTVYTFDEVNWLGSLIRKPNGENLLEVGCSAGYFLLRARERGWNTYGIDIDRKAVEYAREKYNLNVVLSSLSESSFPANYFKVIVFIGVLEHIPDPVGYLSMARRFLKEDGVILVAVPNVSSLNAKVSRLSRHDWDMFCEPGHLYHFNIKTISLLAERCGLAISGWRTTTIKIRGKIPILPIRICRLERTIHSFCKRSAIFRIIYETSLRTLDLVNLGDILSVKMVKK